MIKPYLLFLLVLWAIVGSAAHAESPFALPDEETSAGSVAAQLPPVPADETPPSMVPQEAPVRPVEAPGTDTLEDAPAVGWQPDDAAPPQPVIPAGEDIIATDASSLLQRGVELVQQGHLQEAEAVFFRAVQAEPENPKTWNDLGLARKKQGRIKEAARAYRHAVAADPAFAVAHKNLGVVFEELGDLRSAVKAYNHYCRHAPEATDVKQVKKRADWLARKQGK